MSSDATPGDGGEPTPRRRSTLLQALEMFRAVNPEFSATHMIAFLYVCENEGISVTELAHICRFTLPTASRTVRALAPADTPGAVSPSIGLVEMFQNPANYRGRLLYLTEPGHDLRERLEDLIRNAWPIVAA